MRGNFWGSQNACFLIRELTTWARSLWENSSSCIPGLCVNFYLCQTSVRTYLKKILPGSESTLSGSMLMRFVCLCVLITVQFFQKWFFHCYINIIHHGKFSFHTIQTAVSSGPMLASPLYGLFCLLARPALLSTCAHLESLNPSQMLWLISCLAEKVPLIDNEAWWKEHKTWSHIDPYC